VFYGEINQWTRSIASIAFIFTTSSHPTASAMAACLDHTTFVPHTLYSVVTSTIGTQKTQVVSLNDNVVNEVSAHHDHPIATFPEATLPAIVHRKLQSDTKVVQVDIYALLATLSIRNRHVCGGGIVGAAVLTTTAVTFLT